MFMCDSAVQGCFKITRMRMRCFLHLELVYQGSLKVFYIYECCNVKESNYTRDDIYKIKKSMHKM